MGQRTPPTDARGARTARYRHHQLRLSGLVLLNGFGFARFLGFGRGLGFVGPDMGNCFGLGCSLHQASPTISITSTLPTCLHGVMQNHQLETLSTGQPKTARPDFLSAGPISSTVSRRHPPIASATAMRVTAIGAKTQRKRLDRSAHRAEKRRCRVRMLRVHSMIRRAPSAWATTDTAQGEKCLFNRQNQAILMTDGSPLGECRLERSRDGVLLA